MVGPGAGGGAPNPLTSSSTVGDINQYHIATQKQFQIAVVWTSIQSEIYTFIKILNLDTASPTELLHY